jgi:HK97 family phage portal protein
MSRAARRWWPFERKAAAPVSRFPGFAATLGHGEAPGSYEGQVREAWRNATAQRCVRLVADAVAATPLLVAGDAHPATALLGPALMETVATHLLLHGNAFLQTGLDHRGMPVALWALRPERMGLETDANGWPAVWLYRVGNRVVRYPAEGDGERPAIMQVKLGNPLDDHLGSGCLGAAAEPVALLNQAARWNRALLANAARPSGALVMAADDAPLSAEQFDRLRDEIEAGFQGAANAGRPMLLEGGLSWQALSLTPAEMDFAGARAAAQREVALAFGVPPMLLGLPGDSTHANYAEANVSLWRLTVLPLVARIAAAAGGHLARWWEGIAIEPDLDAIPALWADRERLWRHVAGADFLSADEKRALLGWGRRGPASAAA